MATPRKEHPYRETPQVEKVKSTLLYFGYGKREAKELARDVVRNLDNYLSAQDIVFKRMSDNLTPRPTQTSGGRHSGKL